VYSLFGKGLIWIDDPSRNPGQKPLTNKHQSTMQGRTVSMNATALPSTPAWRNAKLYPEEAATEASTPSRATEANQGFWQ